MRREGNSTKMQNFTRMNNTRSAFITTIDSTNTSYFNNNKFDSHLYKWNYLYLALILVLLFKKLKGLKIRHDDNLSIYKLYFNY